jgi:hypothetical protein
MSMKNSIDTIRLVAQCLDQLRHRVPQPGQRWTNLEERILEVLKGSHVRIVYGKDLESCT